MLWCCWLVARRGIPEACKSSARTINRSFLLRTGLTRSNLTWIKSGKIKRLCIALHGKSISELRGISCHMESHSVTCHPTQVNASRLNPSQTGQYVVYLPRRDGGLSWLNKNRVTEWVEINDFQFVKGFSCASTSTCTCQFVFMFLCLQMFKEIFDPVSLFSISHFDISDFFYFMFQNKCLYVPNAVCLHVKNHSIEHLVKNEYSHWSLLLDRHKVN